MRRLAGVLFWSCLVAGCGGGQKPVIGVVPKGSSHRFWQAVHAGAVKAAQEFQLEIDWQTPAEADAKAQVAAVEAVLAKHVAGLAVAPADRDGLTGVIDRAANAGIPVVAFASEAGAAKVITTVTTDHAEAGRTAAQRLAELMGDEGECAIVGLHPKDDAATARDEGFRQELKERHPNIRVVETAYSMGSPGQASVIMSNLLKNRPNLTGVFADNEWSSAGVVTTLRFTSATRVRVVAFDANRQLVSDLQDRLVDALIVQDPLNMGYEAVKAIAAKLRGDRPEQRIDSGLYLVDRSNLEDPGIIPVLYPDVQRYLNPPRR